MLTILKVSKRVCLLLLLLTAIFKNVNGDETTSYSDLSFFIFDFPKDYASTKNQNYVSISDLLERNVGGFAFYIDYDKNRQEIIHFNGNRRRDLKQSLTTIKEYLEINPDKVLTLFFFADTLSHKFYELFEELGLVELSYWNDVNEEWPSLESLKLNKKQLIVFTENQDSSPSGVINSFTRNVAEYSYPTKQFMHALDNATNYKLLLTRGYNSYLVDGYSASVNDNPLIINHYIDIWRNTGRIPNYIFFDSRLVNQIGWIKSILGTTEVISGKAKINNQILDKIYWKPPMLSITKGEFMFPYPDNINEIAPSKPGYIFEPQEIDIKTAKDLRKIDFEAIPLEITDDLVAYYTLNDDAKDATNHQNNGTADGVTFTNDEERGDVASFDGDDVIILPKTEQIKIRNSSFTVSVWFNVKEFTKTDHSIIGTENVVYRKGLHLILRDKIPYFGFFANDLSGKTVIKEGKWYHVVWRYNLLNGEQVIYVNGKEDGRSYNHPSFAGEEELVISKSILRDSYFIGKMDDIGIWNRPLGEFEIRNLYNGISNPAKELRKKRVGKYAFYTLLILPFIFIFIFKNKLVQFSKSFITKKTFNQVDEEIQPTRYKNAIYLFGKFEVFDNKGNEISNTFSDKIRALFLVLLSNCQMGKKGITSEDLESILWPDLDNKKAANNRRVNVLKLRNLLQELDGIEIIQNRKSWVLEIPDNVYCDLLEYLKVKQHKGQYKIEYFKNVLPIIKRGEFLKNNTYSELEDFKMSVSYEIIDVLEIYLQNYAGSLSQQEIIEVADRILIIDDLNQVAVQFKAKALVQQNNNKLARHVYESFVRKHKENYDEDFGIPFEEFI